MSTPQESYQAAWVAYINHVTPRDGVTDPCPICVSSKGPSLGCEEGQRLHGNYRLARIGKPIEAG